MSLSRSVLRKVLWNVGTLVTNRRGGHLGLSSVLKALLIGYWYFKSITLTEVPNDIGYQDRTAAGGDIFIGLYRKFDGADQSVSFGDISVLCKTITFNVTLDSTTEKIIDLNGTDSIEAVAGVLTLNGQTGTVYIDNAATTTITTARANVIVVFDTVVSVSALILGKIATVYGTFGIDDMRFFIDTLTATERANIIKKEFIGDEAEWYWLEDGDLLTTFSAFSTGTNGTNSNHDTTSFIEANVLSLRNKYGYNIDVGDGINKVPSASSDFETDGTAWWNAQLSTLSWDSIGKFMTLTAPSNFTVGITKDSSPLFPIGAELCISFKAKSSNSSTQFLVKGGDTIGTAIINPSLTTVWQDYSFNVIMTVNNFVRILTNVAIDPGTIIDFDDIVIEHCYDTAIPPDMLTLFAGLPSLDVLGNILPYKGQAKYNAIVVNSGMLLGDGVMYGTITGLLTTDVITAISTAVPTCTVNGQLDIANLDECYGVSITRGGVLWAFIPMCETKGVWGYDVSGNGNHLALTNSDASNWGSQDLYHYLHEKGVGFAGQFNGIDDKIDFASSINLGTSHEIEIDIINNSTAVFLLNGLGNDNYIYFKSATEISYRANNIGVTFSIPALLTRTLHKLKVVRVDRLVQLYINDVQQGGDLTMASNEILTLDGISNHTGLFYNGLYLLLSLKNSLGVEVFNMKPTGRAATEIDSVGGIVSTWGGTGDHNAILSVLSDKSLTAIGTSINSPQRGNNAIPETSIKLPQVIEMIEACDSITGNTWFQVDGTPNAIAVDALTPYEAKKQYYNETDRTDLLITLDSSNVTDDQDAELKEYTKN